MLKETFFILAVFDWIKLLHSEAATEVFYNTSDWGLQLYYKRDSDTGVFL